MPTLAAITFDRLLEPRSSEFLDRAAQNSMPGPNSKPPNPRPALNLKLERRNSTSDVERKVQQPRITPSLYTTPEATPLPDSPSSYSPSPYVVNHKRRGPRLLKSQSECGITSSMNAHEEEKGSQNREDRGDPFVSSTDGTVESVSIHKLAEVNSVNRIHGDEVENSQMQSGNIVWQVGSSSLNDDLAVEADSPRRDPEISDNLGNAGDFYDPRDSMSHASITEEDSSVNATHRSSKHAATAGEFFDAWEELSSDSGLQPSCSGDLEEELREIRFGLLVEIEKRKQAEEALTDMQSRWQRMRHELSLVGLTLPAYPILESEHLAINPGADLSEQVFIARFVADAVGRGTARAEVETEMEAQIEAKSFEIARLVDRLHYYEAVNHEMCQRNQETIERARRLRQRMKRRQRWVWGSVAAALSLGTAALLWSFLPGSAGRGSASPELKPVEEA